MAILKGVKSQIDVKITAEIDADNGRTIQVPFLATYRKPPVSETRELLEKINSPDGVMDEELIDQYLLGWQNVPTETGEPFPFTAENVAAMLEVREYRAALVKGLLSVVLGKAALQKNS